MSESFFWFWCSSNHTVLYSLDHTTSHRDRGIRIPYVPSIMSKTIPKLTMLRRIPSSTLGNNKGSKLFSQTRRVSSSSSWNHHATAMMKTTTRAYCEISYRSRGDPSQVLEYQQYDHNHDDIFQCSPEFQSRKSDDIMVRVEMWNAPLNPADINVIQGKYPSPFLSKEQESLVNSVRQSQYTTGEEQQLQQSRTVAGSEGWGVVTHVSSDDSPFVKVGDVVTMGYAGIGTYRSSFWAPLSCIVPIDRGLDLLETQGGAAASTIFQLGGTALQMIRSFVSPQPGDVILQNAGNSGVGFMVSQLARCLHSSNVVSIVRRGGKTTDQWNELVNHLMNDGKCAKVFAEEDLLGSRSAMDDFKSELRNLSATGKLPKLGLNAVGGDSASLILRSLDQGGTMVSYGGMSMKPVEISTSQLIFRDLHAVGYWHSRFMGKASLHTRRFQANTLVDAVLGAGVKCPPTKEFSLAEFQDALSFHQNQSESTIRRKVVFRCNDN